MASNRSGFLGRLMQNAKEHGNTIYEELQGNSVITSSVADWNEAVGKLGKGVDKAAALISPTIDATPGKRTIEDTIDEFIFDPRSNLAPLELFALGGVSTSKAAMKGATAIARKLGWKIDDVLDARRGGKKVVEEVVKKKQPVKVAEALGHDVGGASIESIKREAGGVRFYRVDRGGRSIPVLQGGEDAVSKAGEAVVKVLPDGSSHVQSGRVIGRKMADTVATLKPGRARNVGNAKTHVLEAATDDDDFLKSLGVVVGSGPK